MRVGWTWDQLQAPVAKEWDISEAKGGTKDVFPSLGGWQGPELRAGSGLVSTGMGLKARKQSGPLWGVVS